MYTIIAELANKKHESIAEHGISQDPLLFDWNSVFQEEEERLSGENVLGGTADA